MNRSKIYNDVLTRVLFKIHENYKSLYQFEIANYGISRQQIYQLERDNGYPNITILEILCNVFDCSFDYFILGHENWKGKRKFKSRLLNERIAELMGSTDLNTKENAKFMGCSENSLLNWLNGEHMPTTRSIQKICNCFQVSADDLLKYK